VPAVIFACSSPTEAVSSGKSSVTPVATSLPGAHERGLPLTQRQTAGLISLTGLRSFVACS
jgi:hypothetical protein